MKEIKAIIQPAMLSKVIEALKAIADLPGVTVSEVKGFGKSRAADAMEHVVEDAIQYSKKVKLELSFLKIASRMWCMPSVPMPIPGKPVTERSSSQLSMRSSKSARRKEVSRQSDLWESQRGSKDVQSAALVHFRRVEYEAAKEMRMPVKHLEFKNPWNGLR